MPQLMPLNWVFCVFALIFIFLLLISMYYMSKDVMLMSNKNICMNNMNWLW